MAYTPADRQRAAQPEAAPTPERTFGAFVIGLERGAMRGDPRYIRPDPVTHPRTGNPLPPPETTGRRPRGRRRR